MTASAPSSGVEDINYSSIVRTCRSVALAKPYLETLGADGDDEVVAEVSRLYECPWPCTNSNPHTAVAEGCCPATSSKAGAGAKDENAQIALHAAVLRGHKGVVKLLEAHESTQ
jgi:hypothetical protein